MIRKGNRQTAQDQTCVLACDIRPTEPILGPPTLRAWTLMFTSCIRALSLLNSLMLSWSCLQANVYTCEDLLRGVHAPLLSSLCCPLTKSTHSAGRYQLVTATHYVASMQHANHPPRHLYFGRHADPDSPCQHRLPITSAAIETIILLIQES